MLPWVCAIGGVLTLFVMAWQTHELRQLQARRTQLTQERSFQEDELRRRQVRWYQSTQRERIVERARIELSLREPGPADREVVALRRGTEAPDGHPLLRQLARGLNRYGEIGGAVAGVDETP